MELVQGETLDVWQTRFRPDLRVRLEVFERICDAVESAQAWRYAIERSDGPSCLLFSRQNLPHQERTPDQIRSILRGGYVLHEPEGSAQAVLIATGSEVGIAMDAARRLAGDGIAVRVVSMPSTDAFDAQDASYRASVLPEDGAPRFAVEAGVGDGWYKYVGRDGVVFGVDRFGESAPYKEVYAHFGLTPENIATTVANALST